MADDLKGIPVARSDREALQRLLAETRSYGYRMGVRAAIKLVKRIPNSQDLDAAVLLLRLKLDLEKLLDK